MTVLALADAAASQLRAIPLRPERPLLIVDVDEVIVDLAAHLAEFARSRGFRLVLTGYKLDGALRRGDGSEASREEFGDLFRAFFTTQTVHQRAYDGVADALSRLARCMQIVILTNVPDYARTCRIRNLAQHGIEYPLVANAGPKGPAIRWLAERVAAPAAFIDDSPSQLASAADHAADVARIHFVGDPHLRDLSGAVDAAQHAPACWGEIEGLVHDLLCGGGACASPC